MSDDEIVAALTEAMQSSARGNTYAQWAAHILPVVRHLAAEELRAAAEDWWKPGRPHRPVRDWLNARAAALDATADRTVKGMR